MRDRGIIYNAWSKGKSSAELYNRIFSRERERKLFRPFAALLSREERDDAPVNADERPDEAPRASFFYISPSDLDFSSLGSLIVQLLW